MAIASLGGGTENPLETFNKIIKNKQIIIDGSGRVTTTGNSYDGKYWAYCLPYEFVITQEGSTFRWQLPIPPEQFSVSPIAANSITASLGGVVEEYSPDLFYDIQLSGTTGVATPKPIGLDENPIDVAKDILSAGRYKQTDYRAVLDTNDALSAIADVALRAAENVVDAATDVGNATGAKETAKALLDATQNRPLYNRSAINKEYNGYTAIQQLRQILAAYAALKASAPKDKPITLYLINWKDKQMWKVAVRGRITIAKSASRPMLYYYQIPLIGWEQDAPHVGVGETPMNMDRFGKNGDIGNVSTMNATAILGQLNGLLTTVAENGILNVLAPYPIV